MKRNKKWSTEEDHLIQYYYLRKALSLGIPYTMEQMKKLFDRRGFKRSQDAIRNRAYILRRDKLVGNYHNRQKWLDGARWGYFDIETTNFQANFGHMLSWAVYLPDEIGTYNAERVEPLVYDLGNGFGEVDAHANGRVLYDAITRREAINPNKFDKRITKSLLKVIDEEVDILVGYYSTKFDVPFVRSRALYHGLRFPQYQEKIHLDLYYRVRALLKLGRNSLDQATNFLGIEGKNHVQGSVWNAARVGDKQALEYVLAHNIEDVQILAELHNKIGGFRNITRRSL